MEHSSRKRYPVDPKEYKLFEEVGVGVSATVYRALCVPFNETVAVKVLDLEKCSNDFDGIRREVQMMTLIDHPNVLRAYCSFTADRSLWVVMPYMAGGSCLHIIKSVYPEGFEEPVITTLLREVLKALVYLHGHGHIHRDVKAGNILIDTNGAVKLADFGVSACMFDTGDRQRSRNTFVGTPCWMAPEVMQQLHGYDFKADIWSFGITALELAHGHAPFSKYPPMKVLLMTLQNAPPGLDYERDKRFSKSFKDLVSKCLVKDPKKRPTSEKLLKHSFFKHARSNEYLARSLLDGLSPLGDRFRKLKAKEADMLLENKAMYEDKEHLSQQEYIKGISAWNFDLEELKRQAALLDDIVGISATEDSGSNHKCQNGSNNGRCAPTFLSSQTDSKGCSPATGEGELHEFQNFEGSFGSSFPIHPLEALKGCFDVCEDDASTSSPDWNNDVNSRHVPTLQQSSLAEDLEGSNSNSSLITPKNNVICGQQNHSSSSPLTEYPISSFKNMCDDTNGGIEQLKHQSKRNYSGPLTYHQSELFATAHEETLEGRVVQRKGRFKVTSDVGSKVLPSALCLTNPVAGPSTCTSIAAAILPSVQFLLQQNAIQREQVSRLIRCAEYTSCHQSDSVDLGIGDLSQFLPASSREKELLSYAAQLQQSITNLVEEVQKVKLQNVQLQQQLNALSHKGEERVQRDLE